MSINSMVNQTELTVLANAAVTAAASFGPVDVSNVEGPLLVAVSARTGGTGSMTVEIRHSHTPSAGDAVAVPAAAVLNAETGDAQPFAAVTTTGASQVRGVRKDPLRRYVFVHVSGTFNQNLSVAVVQQRKYTERA